MKNATEVADWVRSQIAQGALVPGQRLVEVDLSSATGATRAIVRAALQRLNAEGLISTEHYRGAAVRRFSRREIENIYLIREVLEGLAARLAAERDQNPASLKEAQEQSEAAVAAADAMRYTDANRDWHAALLAMAENPDLSLAIERLRVPILRTLSQTFRSRTIIEAACGSQRRVTAAVLARDAAAAEQAMREHLRAGLAAMVASQVLQRG